MKIACLIPARLASSRFPGKLLAKASGKTILQHTLQAARSYFLPEQIFVATDSQEIVDHIEAIGGRAIWTSPTCPNGTERIAEALSRLQELQTMDIIVNLQADHPCIRPATFQAAIEILMQDPKASMSTVASPIKTMADFLSPHVVKVVLDEEGNALYFSRSPIPYAKDKLPKDALHHIGLYCFRKDFLSKYAKMAATPLQLMEDLEQLKAMERGHRIKVAIVDEEAIGIDTPQDLARFEKHLERLYVC